MRIRGRGRALCLAAMLASTAGRDAWAGDPTAPPADARAAAAAKFRQGEDAFRHRDFRRAADAFAAAHALTGHPSPLFNQAIALEQAGEPSRAANCFAAFLRSAPADEPRRAEATRRRDALATGLALVEIVARSATDVTIDGAAAMPGEVYVDPGDHEVSGLEGTRRISRRVTLAVGARTRIDLDASTDPAPVPAEPVAPSAPPDAGGGLHPAWFFVGVGTSLALGALTIWSGLDANDARDRFDAHPTREIYDEGTGKVTRTNVLLAATLVTAVATGVVGVLATDWSGPSRGSANRRPGSLALSF